LLIDRNNKTDFSFDDESVVYTGKIRLVGGRNFFWLLIVIVGVFIDPNVQGMEWLPTIPYHGKGISFVKELIWLSVAFLSFKLANKKAHEMNEFNFEPIKEVASIFIGIFATMTPALELVGNFAKSPEGQKLINANSLYWGTGILSGFLDNAPTYVNFLTAALSALGGNIGEASEVAKFANGGFPGSVLMLKAISVAAVFFGAMTYIGNGPNFMVKSIAEEIGIKMPSFFGYIIRFSIPFLIPVLLITWLVFFAFV
jgi:Na+/H+ antiporter NhaD/arsenite permease-like protein